MALVLHAGETNKNTFKTLVAAECSGLKVKFVDNFETDVSNKAPEFLKMNPIGKAEEAAIATLKRALGALNTHLGFTQLIRCFWTMVNQPNFKKILGEVKQTESVLPVQSAKEPAQPKEAKPKAKDEPKKEAKREVQKEQAKGVEEEEEAPKPKPNSSKQDDSG